MYFELLSLFFKFLTLVEGEHILLPFLLARLSFRTVGGEADQQGAAEHLVDGQALVWVFFEAHLDEALKVVGPIIWDLRHLHVYDVVPKFIVIPDIDERWQACRKFVRKTTERVDVDGDAVMKALHYFRGDPIHRA